MVLYECFQQGGFRDYLCTAVQDYGLLNFLIPFVLFFIVIYVIADASKIFTFGTNPSDDKKKKVAEKTNKIISAIISFMIVVPSFLFDVDPITGRFIGVTEFPLLNGWFDPVTITLKTMPQISLTILIILFTYMIIKGVGATGADKKAEENSNAIVYIMMAVVALIFLNSMGILVDENENQVGIFEFVKTWIVQALIIGGLLWFVVYLFSDNGSTTPKGKNKKTFEEVDPDK